MRHLCKHLHILTSDFTALAHLLGLRCLGEVEEFVVALLGFDGSATLDIGNHQGESLVLAIAPLGDIILVKSALSKFGARLTLDRCEFAVPATDTLLLILVAHVEVWRVCRNSQAAGNHQSQCSDNPLPHLLLLYGFNQEADDQCQDDKTEVVGHLHMVAQQLHGACQCGKSSARKVFPTVAPYNASKCGGDIGEREQLPYVSGTDEDEVIT